MVIIVMSDSIHKSADPLRPNFMGIMANSQQQHQQHHQQQPKQPPTTQPIKSYSDFMRSLAAKYNNNE